MNYQEARRVRKTGLLSLINEGIFDEGKGLGGAVGGAISKRFKAKSVGIQEALDPLNWVRKLTGQGAVGDLAVTGLGRLFGRSNSAITAFGGYGRKNKNKKKNPQRTTVGAHQIKPLKVGDSSADILGKMYNFMQKTHEIYKLNYQIEDAFRQEQMDEDERRHKKLIEAILNRKIKPADDKGVKSFIEKLSKTIGNIIKNVMSKLWAILPEIILSALGLMEEAIKGLGKYIFKYISKLIDYSLGKIFKQINILRQAITDIQNSLTGITEILELISPAKFKKYAQLIKVGLGLSVADMAKSFKEEEDEEDIKDAQTLIGEKALNLYKQAKPLADELKYFIGTEESKDKLQKEYDNLINQAEEESKKYQKEILNPVTEALGYVPDDTKYFPGIYDSKLPAFKDENGNDVNTYQEIVPKIEAYKKHPEIGKLLTGNININKFGEYGKLREDLETILSTEKKKWYDPQDVEVKNIPDQIDPHQFDKQSLAPGEEIISNTQTNNIKGNKPKQVSLNTPNPRNADLQAYLKHTSAYV
jgi:hypothetical protein